MFLLEIVPKAKMCKFYCGRFREAKIFETRVGKDLKGYRIVPRRKVCKKGML